MIKYKKEVKYRDLSEDLDIMKIEKLNYFLTAAEYLNFSKAAEACHIAQPAISKQIHSLEQELGVPLFIRFGHCVKLTPAGHHFYRSLSAFMEDYRESFCRAGRQIHAGKP